jgi:restriction endonuclease Mrr
MAHDDPVVARVREAGRKIAEECDFDPHKMGEWLRKAQAKYADRVVGFEYDKKRQSR